MRKAATAQRTCSAPSMAMPQQKHVRRVLDRFLDHFLPEWRSFL